MGTESGTPANANSGDQRVRVDKEYSWVWKDREIVVFTAKSAYKILRDDSLGWRGISMWGSGD